MTTRSPTHSLPTAEEVAIARESSRALSALLQTRAQTQQIEIFDDKGRVPSSSRPDVGAAAARRRSDRNR